MPIERSDNEVSETGNWNVASSYAEAKIMKPLILADEYETIAYFGTSTLFEEYQLQIQNKDSLRISAFKRLIKTLILLIDNTVFAIKKVADRELLIGKIGKRIAHDEKGEELRDENGEIIQEDYQETPGYKKQLQSIEKIIPSLYSIKKNFINKTQETSIDQEKFQNVLDIVSQIKANINIPLNNNHLIFTNKEEYDPKKAKEKIMADAISHG